MTTNATPRALSMPAQEQLALFTGGYPLVSAEITWHFDGRNEQAAVGYHIYSTETRETIEMATLGVVVGHGAPDALSTVIQEIHRRVWRYSSPF